MSDTYDCTWGIACLQRSRRHELSVTVKWLTRAAAHLDAPSHTGIPDRHHLVTPSVMRHTRRRIQAYATIAPDGRLHLKVFDMDPAIWSSGRNAEED